MAASNTAPVCELDKELEELLRGAGPRETRFRLKIREILNDELATFRTELSEEMQRQTEAFVGGLKTNATRLVTDVCTHAARKTKTYVENELLSTERPPTRDTAR